VKPFAFGTNISWRPARVRLWHALAHNICQALKVRRNGLNALHLPERAYQF